jgi:hypothetical protein
MSEQVPEARQISLEAIFRRFHIAMLRFQSRYGEEEERPDDGIDLTVLRTKSTSDNEKQVSTILGPSLPGDAIAGQLAKEFVAEDPLWDGGVGECDDICYSECFPNPGDNDLFRSRNLEAITQVDSSSQIDELMSTLIPFIVPIPKPARVKPYLRRQ